jgi:hypothetical protein
MSECTTFYATGHLFISPLVGLDLPLLRAVSDERLIEAADDEGNRGQVWKLLHGGVNVDASDK